MSCRRDSRIQFDSRALSDARCPLALTQTSDPTMSVLLERHLGQLHHNQEHYERFVDLMATVAERSEGWGVVKSLMHGGVLAAHAHDRYLPAARAYLDYVSGHKGVDVRDVSALKVRGSLGANARRLYDVQRPVFNLTLDLLLLLGSVPLGGIPLAAAVVLEATPFKRQLQDRCWMHFKSAERRWLAHARTHQLSR